MTPLRKAVIGLSLVLSLTAIQVPASADPVEDGACMLEREMKKYGWQPIICVGP